MNQCRNCWMKEFKHTKDRPMTCSYCELRHHWNELTTALRESLVVKIPKRFCDFVTSLIEKIL